MTSTTYPSGYAPHSGAGMAQCDCWDIYYQSCHLITPSFTLSAQAPTVNFWFFKNNITYDYGDYLSVYYRVNSGSWVQLGGPYSPYNGSNTWTNIALQMPTLTGSIQVAFFGYSAYMYNLHVDDVVIATASANDVGCTSIPSPVGDTGTYTPTAIIHNYGSARQNSFAARYYASGPGATYDNTITGLHMAVGADTTVSFPSWHITVRGSWALKCSTQLTGDAQTSNDKYATNRDINPLPPPPTS